MYSFQPEEGSESLPTTAQSPYAWMDMEALDAGRFGCGREWRVLDGQMMRSEKLGDLCTQHFGDDAKFLSPLVSKIQNLLRQASTVPEQDQPTTLRHSHNKVGQETAPTSLLWCARLLDSLLWAYGAPELDYIDRPATKVFDLRNSLDWLNTTGMFNDLSLLLSESCKSVQNERIRRTAKPSANKSQPPPATLEELLVAMRKTTGASPHYRQIQYNVVSVLVAMRRHMGVRDQLTLAEWLTYSFASTCLHSLHLAPQTNQNRLNFGVRCTKCLV